MKGEEEQKEEERKMEGSQRVYLGRADQYVHEEGSGKGEYRVVLHWQGHVEMGISV